MSPARILHFPPQDRPPPPEDGREWAALASEPAVLYPDDFRQLAVNCAAAGASDLTLQTDQPVRCRIGSALLRVFRRDLSQAEISGLLRHMYGSDAAQTLLASRRVLDFSWEIPVDRARRSRWRVNATAILSRRGGAGAELSLRSLPSATPTLEDVGLPDAVWPLLSPPSGLVIVAGATGQGKSTTLAALVRRHLTGSPVKIVDIEAPIEFTYGDIRTHAGSSIGQSEVGVHIPEFADGVRSALRRSPDIVMIGEVRDRETAEAAVEAALTGHLVYTTLHAGDGPEVFRRLHALLDRRGAEAASVDILQTFRAAVAQRLLPAAGGLGRHPAREICVMDPELRELMGRAPPEKWPSLLADRLREAPASSPSLRPFARDVRDLLDAGLISAAAAQPFLRRGAREPAA